MPGSPLGIKERVDVCVWYETTKSLIDVQRRFRREYCPNNPDKVPDHKTILKWHRRLYETGSVLDAKKQRTRTVRTEEMSAAVVGVVEDDPHMSIRRVSNLFSLSAYSVHMILKEFKFHPYKMQTVQAL